MIILVVFNMLKLFDNMTRSRISWNLIVYRELSAGKLAKMLKKNVSTITRNLEIMKDANLIQLSKVKSKNNLQVKFWRINPEIFREPSIVDIKTIENLPLQKKQEITTQLNNFILLSQSIIQNILTPNLEEHKDNINLVMFLLDKKTGKLFNQKVEEFIQDFLKQNKQKTINLDNLGLDNYIYFLISSQIRNSVPPKEK